MAIAAVSVGAACGPKVPPVLPPDGEGLLGIHTERLPEGVLVTRVAPDAPAAAAGLAPGDLLLQADARPLAGLMSPNRLLRGPLGTPVTLVVAGPLGAPPRTVTVARGAVAPGPRPQPTPPLPGPDLILPDGSVVDLGGDARARLAALGPLAQADPDAARALALALRAVGHDAPEAAALGLPPDLGVPVRAPLPPVPSVTSVDLDGAPAALPPDRPTIVAFWATWCAPCRQELPALAAWARAHPGAAVWAVNVEAELAADRLRAVAAEWGLEGARLLHDPSLGVAFDVDALPTTLVIGADGALHHRVRGTSPRAVSEVLAVADAAVAAPGAPPAVAATWGTLGAATWAPAAGARAVAADATTLWVGRSESPPQTAPLADLTALSTPPARPSPSGAVAASGVVGDPGRLVLRAWSADGDRRWMRTLPAPLTDLEADGAATWAAMGEGGAVLLDADGGVVAWTARPVQDLARGPDGALWGVGGGARFRVTVEGDAAALSGAGPAPAAHRVAADGALGGSALRDLVALPGGGWAALRRDGHLLRVGPDGAIAGRAAIRGARDLAVAPDGRLFVALDDLGVLAFEAPPASEAP